MSEHPVGQARRVVISGASRGIGLACAQRLSAEGWRVIGLARGKVEGFPGELISCDLEDVDATAAAVAGIHAGGPVQALVNNAGIVMAQPLAELDFEAFNRVINLNVRAAIQLAQAFVPAMRVAGYGRIVNVCSQAVFGSRNRVSYSAAKSGLLGCTRTWALEFVRDGITVNAVAPGPIETEMFRSTRPMGGEVERQVIESVPMKRIGRPEEIAGAVSYFLSETAGFATGQLLTIDGGRSIGGY